MVRASSLLLRGRAKHHSLRRADHDKTAMVVVFDGDQQEIIFFCENATKTSSMLTYPSSLSHMKLDIFLNDRKFELFVFALQTFTSSHHTLSWLCGTVTSFENYYYRFVQTLLL